MVHGQDQSLCYVSYNHENKRDENVFNQHDFGVEEMLFELGKYRYRFRYRKKWQISSKYRIE